ncbi:MAG: translocation/assembly module TamB domain-containing protein [Candidatus Saccharibacteria bacterium]|nr:translocation/assembly module TamB domain-containing protein [Moraxellaceae bacterium]
MTEPIDAPIVPNPPKRRTRLWVSTLSIFIGLVALLFVGFLALAGSNSGTQWLLNRVSAQQSFLTYHYVSGNLQNGVILDHVKVNLAKVDISAKRINLRVGWRSIVQGRIHLTHTLIDDLVIFSKTAPTATPFKYAPIRLPFTLYVTNSTVNGLTISQMIHDPVTHQLVPKIDVVFSHIFLKRARWKDDLLTLSKSSIKDSTFEADQVTGTMQFHKHYPINVKGRLIIPLLQKENFSPFQVVATGDLEEIHGVLNAEVVKKQDAKLDSKDDQYLKGDLVIRPMDHIFSLKGNVAWNAYHWPFAASQNFYSKSGHGTIQTLAHGLSIDVNTDFGGHEVPVGQYTAKLFTDFKGLDIQSFNAKIAKGTATGSGRLDWHHDVHWVVKGQLSDVEVAQFLPPSVLPYAPYLPKTLTGPFSHMALMNAHESQLGVGLTSPDGEHWIVGVGRAGSLGNNDLPLAVVARWEKMNRTLPGVGEVNTARGEAKVKLNQGHVFVDADLDMLPSQHLPAGHYTATFTSQSNGLKIPALTFKGVDGSFGASASMDFATKAVDGKAAKPMSWASAFSSKGLDISKILSSPIERVEGMVVATGVSTAAQQTFTVKPALTGLLKSDAVQPSVDQKHNASPSTRSITLTGLGQASLQMNTAKNTHGLKSYAAKFDGDLKGSEAPSGSLNIQVSGTPEITRIEKFEHNGVAGKISATGQVMTKDGLKWSATGKLNNFNAGFFLPKYPSVLSGGFNTTGQWSTTARYVQVTQLDLSGTLKKQPLIAKGTLDASFDPKSISPLPSRMNATNFILDWAGNRITANGGTTTVKGAPRGNFNILVDAKNLSQINSDFSGRIFGTIDLVGNAQTPDAKVNLAIEKFKSPTLSMKNATLVGQIPQLGLQPSQLVLTVSEFRNGKQIINNIDAKMSGTQASHVLDFTAKTPRAQVSLQVAGGLNAQHDWSGEVRQGLLVSKKMTLRQEKPAALQYLNQSKKITLGAHCWSGAGRFCLTEPLVASAALGHVSITLDELDLSGFHDVMPSGMVWMGKLQGQATADWQGNSPLQINAQFSTENGSIGLAADDPQDPPSTLSYQRMSLLVATQTDGIKIRFDAKTPNIGEGYIDAIIDPKPAQKTINGALVLTDVQLKVFKPFFPGIRELTGLASLAGGMSGPLTNPAFYGEFKLSNGKIIASRIPLSLQDINLSSSIRGTQATLSGQFASGGGKGTITGLANWVDQPIINLKLDGNELAVRQPPMLTAAVSPHLEVQVLPVQRQVTINGRVDIPRGVVSPGSNSSNAIAKSSDVRIVYLDQDSTAAILQNVRPWSINADINIALGNEVYFRGFGANAHLKGGLQIRERGTGVLTVMGQISLQPNAKVDAYGQSLILRKSNVIFDGPMLQPQLDIEAYKLIDNRTVGVRVSGRANNPKINTFNDAGLTEQETYSAILSGHINSTTSTINNTAGFRSDVNNALAAAGISAGLSGSRAFTNELGGVFGLSNLTFDADGADGSTKVNVTGYLSPDLYIRYGVGVFTPVNKLTLRYQMSQRFYMEASSSVERAIDFFYNWRF